jgi:hypothetical protein
VEETLCCGAKGITTSIHITMKAPEIAEFNADSYTLWTVTVDKICKRRSIFLKKNPLS